MKIIIHKTEHRMEENRNWFLFTFFVYFSIFFPQPFFMTHSKLSRLVLRIRLFIIRRVVEVLAYVWSSTIGVSRNTSQLINNAEIQCGSNDGATKAKTTHSQNKSHIRL